MPLFVIMQISFGRDFEQQLSFYVESRANFSNLDAVLVTLVQVCNLARVYSYFVPQKSAQ